MFGRGYSRTAAPCHPMGGLPQLGVAGRYDARGLAQHDQASLHHNLRRVKRLTGAKGKNRQLI